MVRRFQAHSLAKSNQIDLIGENRAQCWRRIAASLFESICHSVLFLFFCCFFTFYLLLLSCAARPLSPQLRLGFSSQRTSLHCTIVDATLYTTSAREMHACPSTQKKKKKKKSVVGVTVGRSSQRFAIYIRFFPFRSVFDFVLRRLDMITFVCDRILRPSPPEAPPIHRMLGAPSLCKDQRASNKAMRCPNFFLFSSKLKNL